MNLSEYFLKYRSQIVGINSSFIGPYGEKKIVYADWIASGRLYKSLEDKLIKDFGPFVSNTHTETSETGTMMTQAYKIAQCAIKRHVNAGKDDVLINTGYGMTAAINKLQRILGLRQCGKIFNNECLEKRARPVVFVSHMEHHSNHTSWYATAADVVVIPPGKDMLVDLNQLEAALKKYADRSYKIGAFTACSNVTGVFTPYHEMAKLMHQHGGLCFVDFAASAPYVKIDMHPVDPLEKLDAIYFSPHKFLGGPGASGVLIFDKSMYFSKIPDQPGGGTVEWTNPWGEYKFVDDIETREDGGTPGFLQTIRTALALRLKEDISISKIAKREKEQAEYFLKNLIAIPGVKVLAGEISHRLPVFSFYHLDIHYNLIVKLLSDRYGIQTRGGCACAGTYGHFLLEVSHEESKHITDLINHGDLSLKPGWVRVSLHPTTTNEEMEYILNAIREVVENHVVWGEDYNYDVRKNEFFHKTFNNNHQDTLAAWFTF
ncbi:MAG: selenocysteine lyase [Bacteroidetes bacterium HGW-Bacteroidetes-21]|nr:MAG: selenocysteine lyase [Bacteroidetes bacterium HGW-Bacteroidetes-21]